MPIQHTRLALKKYRTIGPKYIPDGHMDRHCVPGMLCGVDMKSSDPRIYSQSEVPKWKYAKSKNMKPEELVKLFLT